MLLPDDWDGHPLRKDYEFPEEYHGDLLRSEAEIEPMAAGN